MKVIAKVINQQITLKEKKVQADLNEYATYNIPVCHCYSCNVLLANKPSLSLNTYKDFCTCVESLNLKS